MNNCMLLIIWILIEKYFLSSNRNTCILSHYFFHLDFIRPYEKGIR